MKKLLILLSFVWFFGGCAAPKYTTEVSEDSDGKIIVMQEGGRGSVKADLTNKTIEIDYKDSSIIKDVIKVAGMNAINKSAK